MHRCPSCGHPIPVQELLTAADFVTFHCGSCEARLRVERRRYFQLVTLALLVTLILVAATLRAHPGPAWFARALAVAAIVCALITIPLYRIELDPDQAASSAHRGPDSHHAV